MLPAAMLRYATGEAFAQVANEVIIASVMVKVPEMAESISEGTLKQWSKSTWKSWKFPIPFGAMMMMDYFG